MKIRNPFAAASVRIAALLLAATTIALTPSAQGAETMGRLFFTPQQRAELDRAREQGVTPPREAVVEERRVTVNGRVARSSGKTTTWINGVPQYDTYRGRDASRVTLPDEDSSVRLKVGQTADRAGGPVTDPLGGGTIRVKPASR